MNFESGTRILRISEIEIFLILQFKIFLNLRIRVFYFWIREFLIVEFFYHGKNF